MRSISFILFAVLSVGSAAGQTPIPGVNRSPFGAQTVWPNNPDLVRFLDRMQEAGIQWGRFDLCWWGLAETQPGVYNFNPGAWQTDRAIALMHERNIEPFPILCYSNPLYDGNTGPSTDAGRTAFGNYCQAAALRYRDSITYWEIWNEPNLEQFWGRAPAPVDYAQLVIVAAARIREANPHAVVVGGVTSGIDQAFLSAAFDNGLLNAIDAVTVHPYRQASPESTNTEITSLRGLMDSATTRTIPIWSGEWGYNTAWSGITDKAQAKCLSRMLVNNLAQGINLSIWFSTHPFAEDPTQPDNPQWGLIDYQFTPRPSFYAMQTLNQRLPAPVRKVSDPFGTVASPQPSYYRLAYFERGDSHHLTAAVWVARWPAVDTFTGRTTALSFSVPTGTQFRAFDGLTNAEIPLSVTRNGERSTLSNFTVMDYPIYIEITTPSPNGGFVVR